MHLGKGAKGARKEREGNFTINLFSMGNNITAKIRSIYEEIETLQQ